MKIKTKLTLWIGLLFILIIFTSVTAIHQMQQLAVASEHVLADNYNSLRYARNMLTHLDQSGPGTASLDTFDKQLQLQENNITEHGEDEITKQLRTHFNAWKQDVGNDTLRNLIQRQLYQIMEVNLRAIEDKNVIAARAADKAILYIPAAAGLAFMIALILLINLPGSIANPIRELTERIKAIAAEKYSQRVHFERTDEFGELASSFNTMARKLEEYNNSNLAKIMMEKKRIDMLINNMHDPVIGLDESGIILFANQEALSILHMAEADCIGKSAATLAVSNDLLRMLISNLKSTDAKLIPPLKIFADDRESFFEKEVVPIEITPTGEMRSMHIGDVIILRNVTQYKELDAAKTNFIATLSHEFKTPISAIRMGVNLLRKEEVGPINTQQAELLNGIDEDASRLLRITGEILNLSQVETGHLQINMEPVRPIELMQRAMEANQVAATQRDVKFVTQFESPASTIMADDDKVTWVLSNLIANAIRYSYEHASIQLLIQSVGDKIRFTVEDTGQGIASEYQARIFDKYFRIPGSSKEGTGLGLAISKELIEAQGGSIEVESELGKGSRFTVVFKTAALQ